MKVEFDRHILLSIAATRSELIKVREEMRVQWEVYMAKHHRRCPYEKYLNKINKQRRRYHELNTKLDTLLDHMIKSIIEINGYKGGEKDVGSD